MNLNMLEQLSTDALKAMQEKIGELLKARLDDRPIPGRKATFIDKSGVARTVRIDKRNITTFSCTEIEPNSGTQWRIYPQSLKVHPVERKMAPPLPPKAPVKPSTNYGQDAW